MLRQLPIKLSSRWKINEHRRCTRAGPHRNESLSFSSKGIKSERSKGLRNTKRLSLKRATSMAAYRAFQSTENPTVKYARQFRKCFFLLFDTVTLPSFTIIIFFFRCFCFLVRSSHPTDRLTSNIRFFSTTSRSTINILAICSQG